MGLMARDWPLWFVSSFVWRLPGKPSLKLAGFSHTEQGSGLDMLAATEETDRREMRARYFRHALDELKHAVMFKNRAAALAPKTKNRTTAVLNDAEFIASHGINQAQSLFKQLGELEFLAFVWVAEKRAVEQFDVYTDILKKDTETVDLFNKIFGDEMFHVSYSRAELDRYAEQGQAQEVKQAIFRVKRRRVLEIWLRFSRVLGDFMSTLWLSLIYILILGPSSVMAKLTEKQKVGFIAPEPVHGTVMERAALQG